jgi:predicted DNA-binding transcriptional regulator AlpA
MSEQTKTYESRVDSPRRDRTLIRIGDVADIVGVKPTTVREYLIRIPAFPEPLRIGSSLFWIKQDVVSYLDSLEQAAADRLAERKARAAA